MKDYPHYTIVVCGIIYYENKVLIALRNDVNKWEFPGGKQKPKETLRQCLMREIREELNYTLDISNDIFNIIVDDENKLILYAYKAKINKGKLILTAHKECKWVNINELDTINMLDNDKRLIRRLKTYAEYC